MIAKEYSEKEIAILNATVDLMKSGVNPYLIKVSDIAETANIGKGTIYDYFSSKEEVISTAIIYNTDNEIKIGYERIKNKKTFKNKYYEILNIMRESMEYNLSTLDILLSTGGIQEFYKHIIVNEGNGLCEFHPIKNEIIDHILETGFKEGVIKRKGSNYYQSMAMKGSIAGFSNYIGKISLYKGVTMKEAMDTAYELLINALN
jgi:hypothetical protein